MQHSIFREKDVFVCPYCRIRYGRLENVRQHWRSHPHRLVIAFN